MRRKGNRYGAARSHENGKGPRLFGLDTCSCKRSPHVVAKRDLIFDIHRFRLVSFRHVYIVLSILSLPTSNQDLIHSFLTAHLASRIAITLWDFRVLGLVFKV